MHDTRTAPTRAADALTLILEENARVSREVPESVGTALVQLLQAARGAIFPAWQQSTSFDCLHGLPHPSADPERGH